MDISIESELDELVGIEPATIKPVTNHDKRNQ